MEITLDQADTTWMSAPLGGLTRIGSEAGAVLDPTNLCTVIGSDDLAHEVQKEQLAVFQRIAVRATHCHEAVERFGGEASRLLLSQSAPDGDWNAVKRQLQLHEFTHSAKELERGHTAGCALVGLVQQGGVDLQSVIGVSTRIDAKREELANGIQEVLDHLSPERIADYVRMRIDPVWGDESVCMSASESMSRLEGLEHTLLPEEFARYSINSKMKKMEVSVVLQLQAQVSELLADQRGFNALLRARHNIGKVKDAVVAFTNTVARLTVSAVNLTKDDLWRVQSVEA